MDQETDQALGLLRDSAQDWESQAILWEDPRVAGLEDIAGSRRTAKEIAGECRARARKLREVIGNVTSPKAA
jgi:hypothetical protein